MPAVSAMPGRFRATRRRAALTLAAVTTAALIAVASPYGAAASTAPTEASAETESAAGRYIVQVAGGDAAMSAAAALIPSDRILHRYSEALDGFAAELTDAQVQKLRALSSAVEVIPDGDVQMAGEQTPAPGHLDFLDQRDDRRWGDGRYRYDTTGAGATAYVIDSGVRATHEEFGGRVSGGWDFVDNDANPADCNGHGTFVASVIAGEINGVAKDMRIVPLRAFPCYGTGHWSTIIAAVDWVILNRKGPAVINLSISGDPYTPMDEAVARAIASGVSVVVAAGDGEGSSCTRSPARAPGALTVGTMHPWGFPYGQTTGSCTDIWGPGGEGMSGAGHLSDTETAGMSGTSATAPIVAGVVGRLLETEPHATPERLAQLVDSNAGHVDSDEYGQYKEVYANPGTFPSVPTSTRVTTDDSKRAATVTWDRPVSDGGLPLTGYALTWGPPEWPSDVGGPMRPDRWTTTVPATARSYTFVDLPLDTEIELWVKAINTNASGPNATHQVYFSSAPSTPTSVAATADAAKRTATLTWAPPESEGISPITGYRVERNGTDAGGWGPWSTVLPATARSHAFLNLVTGSTYNLRVTAINAHGDSPSGWATVTIPRATVPGIPTSVTAVSDNANRTATLKWAPPASDGGSAITGYQVSRDGNDAAGYGPWSTTLPATARSHAFLNLAVGSTYTLTVKAINATGTGAAASTTARIAALPNLTPATPTITGTAKVGSTLTANPGAWGPAPVTYAYQWKAGGTAITGATGSTYQPTSSTVGKTITVTVTGSKSGYTTASRTSAATVAVVSGTLTAVTPTITGTAKVGSTLTANPGTWGPGTVTFTYQWKAAGTAISGATAKTYVPTSSVLGKTITVTVTGTKAGYTTANRTSAATAAVASGTLTTATPTITGTAKVGSTLTANPGTWGPGTVTLTYQWKAAGVSISGATAKTYVPTSTTVGKTITVIVTGKKTGYTTATRTSAATAAVIR